MIETKNRFVFVCHPKFRLNGIYQSENIFEDWNNDEAYNSIEMLANNGILFLSLCVV